MSLIVANVTKERALLAADTRSSAAQPGHLPWKECAKIVALPHMSAAVAGNGNADLLYHFTAMILRGDFDAVCNGMAQGLVDVAMGELKKQQGIERFDIRDEQTIVIAGWSTALGRMRGLCAERVKGDATFQVVEFGHIVAPPLPDGPIPDSPEKVREIAARQVEQTHRTIPSCPIGGHVILCDITKDAMRIDRHPLP